jgi:tetratricopeptide (TPR) repeat protein
MNYLRTILFLFFTNFVCLGQNNPIHNHTFLCGYNDEVTSEMLCNFMKYNSFSNNAEAELKVAEILKPIGIPPNFILVSCPSIQNAVAITYNGDRFIVYDNKFIEEIELKSKNKWVNISILSHEIAHHLMAHTLKDVSLDQKRKYELEADEFSGFILAKLGASLEDAQAAIKTIGHDGDDSNSTHPSKVKRLKAIQIGWEKGRKDSGLSIEAQNESFECIYNRAWALLRNNKLEESLALTNKLLELKRSSMVYYLRAIIYYDMNKYEKAIIENTHAIQIEPDFVEAYYNRGCSYLKLNKYFEAKTDFLIALEIYPMPIIYHNLGSAHNRLGEYNEAITALNVSISLMPEQWDSHNLLALVYNEIKEYEKALIETNKALEKNGDKIQIYNTIVLIYMKKENYNNCIEYYSKIINLDVNNYKAFSGRGSMKSLLGDYQGAIVDLTRAIDINPNYIDSYQDRAQVLYDLKEYEKAKRDILRFLELCTDRDWYIEASLTLGDIYIATKKMTEAIELYSKLIEMKPNSKLYLSVAYTDRARARMLSSENYNLYKILEDLDKAIEINPELPEPYYLKGLNFIREKGKIKKEGCKYLQKSCELGFQLGCDVLKEEKCK